MNELKAKRNKSNIFEIIVYVLAGLIALWGLTYLVLGLIAENLNVLSSKNELLKASNTIKRLFGLGFVGWGMILLGIGALLAIIVLAANAKKSDRAFDREARRAARRNRLQTELGAPTAANEVIDVEVAPVEKPENE